MEIKRDDVDLSKQIDYKKIKSDWDVFNHQQDYDRKSQNRFFSNVTKIAKHCRIMSDISQLQDKLSEQK